MVELPFFPPQASTVAGQVDLLLLALIGLSSVFTLIVVALIAYFGIKYRRGRSADRSQPPEGNVKMELSWVAGLLVLAVGTFTWASLIYLRSFNPPGKSLDIYVVGKQWMWKFQHQEGPREIDTLHVPVNRPVRLVMTSQDVIHSLYIPAFRLKYDVIPGRYTDLYFEANQTGEYHIFCTEYCGTNHSQMRGTVIVMEPRDYQAWLSGSTVSAPLSQAGQDLFTQLGCSSCHAAGANVRAPSLVGLFGSQVPLEGGGSVTADESYIRESIFFPQKKIVAGYDPIMPTYDGRITEEQMLQLVAYIKSLGNGASQGVESSSQATEAAGTTSPTPLETSTESQPSGTPTQP
jgi:cytochrome c oxidase subunit 2